MEAVMKEKISLWVNSIGPGGERDVWTDLRWVAIDLISRHLWGEKVAYKTLTSQEDRALMSDVLYPKNIYLPSWLIHFPRFSYWLEKSIGTLGMNPMQTIRDHAFEAFQKFKTIAPKSERINCVADKLWTQHVTNGGDMTDEAIAAELGDLLLAGMDTTPDTLCYLFWLLSKLEHAKIQERLRDEVRGLHFENGMPSVVDADKLVYLDAVLKETLRLFPINAGSQPRVCPSGKPIVIYDLQIPAGTICEMQALSVNRDPEIFDDPDAFDPDRWLLPRDSTKFKEMNRSVWSFSSGQRMCIGQQYFF